MPLTPEDAQKLNNLQQRVLANIAAGRQSNDGITQEEVRESLHLIRQNRTAALAAGEAKKPRAKKEKAPSEAGKNLDNVLQGKFGGLNLD